MSYSYLLILRATKKSLDTNNAKTTIIKKMSWKFRLKKYKGSKNEISKPNKKSIEVRKKTEKELKEFNKLGKANSIVEDKWMP